MNIKFINIFIFVLFNIVLCENSIANKKPLGLDQLGNNCYLNSVIQSFIRCEAITNFLIDDKNTKFYKENSLAHAYQAFVQYYNLQVSSPNPKLESSKIYSIFRSVERACHFNKGSMQDAQEAHQKILGDLCSQEYNLKFFTINTDNIDQICESQYQSFSKDIINSTGIKKDQIRDNLLDCIFKHAGLKYALYNYFDLGLKSKNICSKCKSIYMINEFSTLIQAPVANDNDIESVLKAYFKQERMEGDNQYFCYNCNSNQDATKQLYMTKLPEYLIVQIKIFDSKLNKIEYHPRLNIDKLDISAFISGSIKGSFHYELFGSSWQAGTFNSGHYISIVRSKEQWYKCDDSDVSDIDVSEFINGNCSSGRYKNFSPYLLFYKKIGDAEVFPEITKYNSVSSYDLINCIVSLSALR